jgi:transposase-like protein
MALATKPKQTGRKGIPAEVKARAIAQVETGAAPRRVVARELGVSEATIRGWEARAQHARDGSHQKVIRESADAIAAEIQAENRETRRIVAKAVNRRLIDGEIDTISVPQLVWILAVLTDKDHKHQELMAKAQAEGHAAGDPHRMDRAQLEAELERVRELRANAIDGTAEEID